MSKVIIIARVSTEEREEAGNSLPAQMVRFDKYCQRENFETVKRFLLLLNPTIT